MGLIAKKPEGADIEPIEAGPHQAICIRYYDLGTHYRELFDKSARRVMIMWEIPDSRIEIEGEDLPRAISREYTLSLHKKATLRADLESWRGKTFSDLELEGFNLDKILGTNCMVNIIHKITDKATYANVAGVMPLMKNMKKRQPENPLVSFSFDDAEIEIPKDTPQWIEDKIKASNEWDAFMKSGSPDPKQEPEGEEWPMQKEADMEDIPF